MAKSLAPAICIVILVFSTPLLFAAEAEQTYHVGIIATTPNLDTAVQMVLSVGTVYGKNIYLDDDETFALDTSRVKVSLLQAQSEIAKAYTSHTAVPDATQKIELPPIERQMNVVYEQVQYNENLAAALSESKEAQTWYAEQNDYDALILVKTEKLKDFERFQVQWVIPNERTIDLVDAVVQNGYYQALHDQLANAILQTTSKGNLASVYLENLPSGLHVQSDSETIPLTNNLLFLSPGEHTLTLTAPSYQPMEIKVSLKANEIHHLSFTLDAIKFKSITLHSDVSKVNWFVQGKDLGNSLSISLLEPIYPLVVTMVGDGFEKKVVQLDTPPKGDLTIHLLSGELSDPTILKDAQKDFYKRLRNTILWFQAYVGSVALSQIYATDSPLWQIGVVGTSSLALVSTIALVMEMFSYEASAGIGN